MDMRGQLASIWLRRGFIVAAAVLVALFVLAFRSLAAPVYATDATMHIVVPADTGTAGADAVAFYAQTVVGLAGIDEVLSDAITQAKLPLTASEAQGRVTVTPGATSGFVSLRATGPSPHDSSALANAMTAALASRLAKDDAAAVANATASLRRQVGDLETKLAALPVTSPERTATEQRYSSLVGALTQMESQQSPELLTGGPLAAALPSPISPTPARDAALAFLVTLIITAEGVVISRALRRRLSESEPAKQIVEALSLPAVQLERKRDPAAALAPLFRSRLAGQPLVTVLQLTPRGAKDLGQLVARTAALVGFPVRHIDLNAELLFEPLSGNDPMVRSLRRSGVDSDVLRLIREPPGPVLVAVHTASTGLRQLTNDVDILRAAGADIVGVLVWRGSVPREVRLPRRASKSPQTAAPRCPAEQQVEPSQQPPGQERSATDGPVEQAHDTNPQEQPTVAALFQNGRKSPEVSARWSASPSQGPR
jgi:capsular polysaccharide biosynthesis protein